MRNLIATALLSLLLPLAALAQTPPAAPAAPAPSVASIGDTPIKGDLEKIFGTLQNQLKEIDALAANLKNTASKKPEDATNQINGAAKTLSDLADKLQPSGELAAQLNALRGAASAHRERLQSMAKDIIEEGDRTALLKSWDKAVIDTDKAAGAVNEMRDRLGQVLTKLRMRQAAVGEYVLAGQYQAAVASLRQWVGDLEATVKSLHAAIDPSKPSV